MMRLTWAAQVKCMGEVCPLPVESTLMRRLNLWFYPGFGCCKSRVSTPVVMQRFRRGNTLASENHCLLQPTEFPSLPYRQRFFKPNPDRTTGKKRERAELPNETYWTGYEARPGMADLRPLILERDEYTCQICGAKVTAATAEVDHSRPVRRFKRPIDANVPENLWTLCKTCHDRKTKTDQEGESRVR